MKVAYFMNQTQDKGNITRTYLECLIEKSQQAAAPGSASNYVTATIAVKSRHLNPVRDQVLYSSAMRSTIVFRFKCLSEETSC